MPIRYRGNVEDQIYVSSSAESSRSHAGSLLKPTAFRVTSDKIATRRTILVTSAFRVFTLSLGAFTAPSFGCAVFLILATIPLSQNERLPDLVIERDQIAPDTLRSFILYIVGECPRWVNKLREGLGITRRRREGLGLFRSGRCMRTGLAGVPFGGSSRQFLLDIRSGGFTMSHRCRQVARIGSLILFRRDPL